MPLAEDTIQGVPPKRERPQPKPAMGVQRAEGTTTGPTLTPIGGKPDPILEQHGIYSSVADFNRRVERAVDAHERAMGYKPSPALVFDVIRSPVPEFEYDELFKAPQSRRVARAAGVLRAEGINTSTFDFDAEQAAADERMRESLKLQNRRFEQEQLAMARLPVGWQSLLLQESRERRSAFLSGRATVEPYGDVDPEDLASFQATRYEHEVQLSGVTASLGLVEVGISQIFESLATAPYGAFQLAKASVLDTRDILSVGAAKAGLPVRARDLTPTRTADIGKAIATSVRDDFLHPADNPGFLLMDAWSILTLGAGGVTRVSAAVGASGAKATAKALIVRPQAGTFDLGVGAYTESVLLSDNAARRAIQKAILGRRQAGLEARLADGYAGRRGPSVLIDRYLSTETKLSREARARLRVEYQIQMTPVRELERASRWTARGARVLETLYDNPTVGKRLRVIPARKRIGVEKAIQVEAMDSPPTWTWRERVEAMRGYHERMIRAAKTNPEILLDAHRAQLAALNAAEKILANPPKQFAPILDLTRRVVAEMESLKYQHLGLDPIRAEARVANFGKVIRGEEIPEFALTRVEGEIKRLEGLLSAKHADEAARARVEPYNTVAVEKKLEKLRAEDARLRAQLEPAEKLRPESFYGPTLRAIRGKQPPTDPRAAVGASRYGVSAPMPLGELTHAFTAKAIMIGDTRIDATALASEAYKRTVRAVTIKDTHSRLWAMSKEKPSSVYDIAIRDAREIPDELRRVVDQIDGGKIDNVADAIDPAEMDNLLRFLFPGRKGKDGVWKFEGDEIPNVRWVDERLLLDKPGDQGMWRKLDAALSSDFNPVTWVNTIGRDTTLFLRPAYALNALGAGVMSLVHQGFLAMPNLGRAVGAKHFYGADVSRLLDGLAGETKTSSYVTKQTKTTAISQALRNFWNPITDLMFRRSAVIYELRRQGIPITREALTDATPAARKKIVEASQRAKKAMVEFDNLTPFEKATLRHVFFVYAWVSRSTVWSVRTLVDHPVKVTVPLQAGRDYEEQIEELIGKVPDWFLKAGYFVADGVGLVDPSFLNPTTILEELSHPVRALLEGDVEFGEAARLFGPGAEFVTGLVTGRNEFGAELEGFDVPLLRGKVGGALRGVAEESPIGAALERRSEAGEPAPGEPDIKNRRALIEAQNAALDRSVFSPGGFWGTWGPLIAGGLAGKEPDEAALAARYWRDQPDEVRLEHDLKLLRQMLRRQAQFIGHKGDLPRGVQLAAEFAERKSRWMRDLVSENGGRPLTPKEKSLASLDVLNEMGLLTGQESDEARKTVRREKDPAEANRYVAALIRENAGTADLEQWVEDIKTVSTILAPAYETALKVMQQEGLGDHRPSVKADEKAKTAYGRRYLAYLKEADEVRDRARQLASDDATVAWTEYRAWEVAQDRPVKVGDTVFPSPVRMEWAAKTAEERSDELAYLIARKEWSWLTGFEKELLGRKVAPTVAEGWELYERVLRDETRKLPPGQRGVQRSQKIGLAKQIEQRHPGFYQDFLFSIEPRLRQVEKLKPFTTGRFAAKWNQVFVTARVPANALKDPDYDGQKTLIRDAWKDYVRNSLLPWIKEDRAFAAEVERYGPNFIYQLLG